MKSKGYNEKLPDVNGVLGFTRMAVCYRQYYDCEGTLEDCNA